MTGANAPSPELEGIVVLDLAGMGPSLRCVRALVDLGARWIKLAPPSAAGRYPLPWFVAGAFRGAEQFELDLKRSEGREVFLRLARKADVIVEGFRPGVADRLGIGYEAVRAVNQGIVYAAVSGYGRDGPYADWVGHDLNYQAMGGALAAAGRRADGAPAMPGLTFGDSAGGGFYASMLVMAALIARQRDGRGRFVDAATAEGVVHLASIFLDEHLGSGKPVVPGNNILTARYAWYDIYATRDGGALAVAAIEGKFFANLCNALGLPQFIEKQWDDAAQPAMREAFAQAFRAKTREQWWPLCSEVEACVSPVLSIEEVARDPHWKARGMFCEFEHPEQGRQNQVRPLGRGPSERRGSSPAAGLTEPERILRGFDFSAGEIASLKSAGVIR